MAQSVLFRHYPANCLPVITLGPDYHWLNSELRANLFGGLSAVFHRHVDTSYDPNRPISVSHTPNGSRVKKIQQLDVNSLYPAVMKCDLPVGSGVFYKREGALFEPYIMKDNTGGNGSPISFHWLNSMQSRFVKDGKITLIQCDINSVEKKIGNYELDGYVYFEGQKIGMDFHGCRYRVCCSSVKIILCHQMTCIFE